MPQKDNGWIFWILVGGAAFAGYQYLSKEEPAETAKIVSYQKTPEPLPQLEQSPQAELIITPAVQKPPPVFEPGHRYAATEDRVYFYLGAASDEERKRGVASGPTMAFRYYGKDSEAEHTFRSYTTNGYPIQFYYCKDPCNLMRDDSGVRTVVDGETIMGAVVEDMRNGFLKKSKRQDPVPTPEQPIAVDKEPVLEKPAEN